MDKTALTYIVVNDDAPALKPTAASIANTWSVSGESHMIEGSPMQSYSPNRDSFKKQPSTTPTTDTPSTHTTTTETPSTNTNSS